MSTEETITAVLAKWSRRGYIEPELVASISADIFGELRPPIEPTPWPGDPEE